MASRSWLYAGTAILLLLTAAALFAPVVAPYDPLGQNLDQDLIARSREHWLGTDKLGRDILSRLIYGSRSSLLVGFVAVGLASVLGLALGLPAGYLGGWMQAGFLALIVASVGFSIVMTWVYNNTRGSILLMILLHSSSNAAISIGSKVLPGDLSLSLNALVSGGWIPAITSTILALGVILITRARLSYKGQASERVEAAQQAQVAND